MNGEAPEKRIYYLQAEFCKTLSHPVRVEIIDHLKGGEKSVGELLSLTGIGKTSLAQHLAVMRQRRVLATRKEGASVIYRIANSKVIAACNIVREALIDQLTEDEKTRQLMKAQDKSSGSED
jgi:ArsR family transcriptional regulator